MFLGIPVALVIAAIVASAAIALLAARLAARSERKPQDDREPSSGSRAIFVFEGHDLVDSSPGADDLLSQGQREGSDWARMLSALAPSYPKLGDRLTELDERGRLELVARDGRGSVTAVPSGSRIRITLTDQTDPCDGDGIDPVAYRAMLSEMETLRNISDNLALPLWRETAEGDIVWVNSAYLDAASDLRDNSDWPPPRLFPRDDLAQIAQDGSARRLSRTARDEPGWYDLRAAALDDDTLFSAVSVDGAVAAETQLRDFMQTLTKTFSHLTTGLAIFDRKRRLTLFNPALNELTGLTPDFMSTRPTLYAVLDRLRERRMIPEPKDYGSWRRQISKLESDAADGSYSETWSLLDGRTFRVTGRPHPGGAVAFLFEDISAEMSLTRRFRAELELGQSVVDALEEAIVVFSPAGTVAMVNRAYQELWLSELGVTLDIPSVTDLAAHWADRCPDSPVWADVRDLVLHERNRAPWEDRVVLTDGQHLRCRVVPLASGATLVGFSEAAPPWAQGAERTGTR